MKKYAIKKSFKFDAAHRLVDGYEGKCAHLHGHTYTVTITIEVQSTELDDVGMVYDFNKLKELKEWIDEKLDHGTMVNVRDVELRDWLIKNKQRTYVFDENPTAEYIAREVYNTGSDLFDIPICSVEVFETPTCSAQYGD